MNIKTLIVEAIEPNPNVDMDTMIDLDQADMADSETELKADLATDATNKPVETTDEDDEETSGGSRISALGFDVKDKPIRSRMFSQALMRAAEAEGVRSAKEVVWGTFDSSVAIKLIQAANTAIKDTLARPDLRPEIRAILSDITVPLDVEFLKRLQASLAKVYILYTSWYYDTLMVGARGKLGPGDSMHTREANATPYPMNQLVGITKKHLVYPTDDVKGYMRAFFDSLPTDIQHTILTSPDNTGVVGKTLRYFKKGSVAEQIILVTGSKPITEAISNAVNMSDNIEELLDISSEKSMMRAIMKGIVQLCNKHNPMTFPAFEAFIVSNFFSERDERELNRKVAKLAPMEFTGDDGEKKEREIRAEAEVSADQDTLIDNQLTAMSDFQDVPDAGIQDPEAREWDLTSLDAGGVWKGINLFHEIDNGNFSALFCTLLKKKYIDEKLDLVDTPETPRNSGIMEPSVHQSLFEWLLTLSESTTRSTSVEGELYSYNEALIDFINIYSEQLKDSMGSSIPEGGISEEQMNALLEATEMFGRKYSVPSLQGIANRSTSQQLANPELYARTTSMGGTNRKQLKQLLQFDFLNVLGREIQEDGDASTGAKLDTLTSLEQIKQLPSPVVKYLAMLKLLYKFNADHGSKLLTQAIKYCKDDKEIYAPIHNTVRAIITGSDEKALAPAKRRGFKDLTTFGIELPTTYPPAETLLFSPVNAIENYIEHIEQTHLEALGLDVPLKDAYYYKEHLLKKLRIILALKKQGEALTEAAEPVLTKKEVVEHFIQECLPIMDNVLADGRRLVRFLRNFVRSNKPKIFFDPTDPLIQRDKSGDFRRTQKAISEPAQQMSDGIENRGLSKKAIYSLVRGYLYNLKAGNAGIFVEIFDQQEKGTLKKLVGLLTNFALTRLKQETKVLDGDKKEPRVLEGDLDNFLHELKLLDAQIQNPDVKEVNLDGVKKYLRLFKPIILDGLLSIKNGQSSSVTMLLRFLASNTLGHVIGLNQGDIVSALKKDAEEKEEISAATKSKQIRPEVTPTLMPYADFDTEED